MKKYGKISPLELLEVSDILKDNILDSLLRDLNIKASVYQEIKNLPTRYAKSQIINIFSKTSNVSELLILEDAESNEILGYTTDSEREYLLRDQLDTCLNHTTFNDNFSLKLDYQISPTEYVMVYLWKHDLAHHKDVGVMIDHNELGSTTIRLIKEIEGFIVYLPPKYYNLSSSRYYSESLAEAVETMISKTIEDFQGDQIDLRMNDFLLMYNHSKEACTSFEEYQRVLREFKRLPEVIDNSDLIKNLEDILLNYEESYAQITEKKSSYIYRCTALNDTMPIESMYKQVIKLVHDIYPLPENTHRLRELFGEYFGSPRISSEIAK